MMNIDAELDEIKKDMNNQAYWPESRARYFNGVIEDIKSLKDKGVFKNKKIAIVGSWNNITPINEILLALGLRITYIADNNPQKQGISRIGIISQSVESLKQESNIIVLVMNNHFYRDLRKQLLSLGMIENEDFYIVFGGKQQKEICALRDNFRIQDDQWEDCKRRIELAYESYEYIYSKYGQRTIWLMHPPSLGDLYILSLFLPTYYGVDSINKCECVLMVTKNSVRELATILGFKYVEMITLSEAQKQWMVMMKAFGEKLDIVNAVSYGLNDIYQTLRNYTNINFCDSFYRYVLNMDSMPSPIYPVFPKRSKALEYQFEKENLISNKTVVISPYAGHFKSNITMDQWEAFAKKLISNGYTVVTNCAREDELPIPGTLSPFIHLKDCVGFVETAGVFVGIRSGFCDLICAADCMKIIISESGVPAGSDRYFSFREMGLGHDVIEYVDDCINTSDMLDSIYTRIVNKIEGTA